MSDVAPVEASDAELTVAQQVNDLLLRIYGRPPVAREVEAWTERFQSGISAADFAKVIARKRGYQQNRSVQTHRPAGHFFSPVVDPESAREYYEMSSREEALPGIELSIDAMEEFWRTNIPFIQSSPFQNEAGENRYGYRVGPFAVGDGTALRTIIGAFRPKRIVEIGSGASSACMLDSAEHANLSDFKLTCIEPYPTRLRRLLREEDFSRVEIHERGVQGMPLDLFRSLEPNDIVFIDSTHVLKTGSDVHYELFYILPILKPGVLIHFHDCRFPLEYSPRQVFEKNYSWNEAYAVRALLMYSNRFTIIFWGSYFAEHRRELVADTFKRFLLNPGSSLWLQVRH